MCERLAAVLGFVLVLSGSPLRSRAAFSFTASWVSRRPKHSRAACRFTASWVSSRPKHLRAACRLTVSWVSDRPKYSRAAGRFTASWVSSRPKYSRAACRFTASRFTRRCFGLTWPVHPCCVYVETKADRSEVLRRNIGHKIVRAAAPYQGKPRLVEGDRLG